MKLRKHVGIYVMILLMFLGQTLVTIARADSHVYVNLNSTIISIRNAELLSNGLLVEVIVDNVIPKNVSIAFNPEFLRFDKRDSTLLISYNARISEDALVKLADFKESMATPEEESLKYIQLFIVFITGLIILVLEILSLKIRSKNNLEKIEKNKICFNNSIIDEESLLLLSSKNPEAYKKTVDMILKGELKVKRRRFGKSLSKIRKFVNFRR